MRSYPLTCEAKRGLPIFSVFALCLTALMPCNSMAQAPAGDAGGGQKPAQGQDKAPASKPLPELGPSARYDYQGEATFILQHLFRFRSKYQGANSLASRDETELSHTYTAYLGLRVAPNLEAYLNPEIAWGNGIGNGNGVAAYTNNDVIGQPNLRPDPYLARYFVRWRIPMKHVGAHHEGGEQVRAEQVGRAPNIIEGPVPAHRLVVQIGKFGVSDVFDVNSYANNPRTQFMNDAFGNNMAYDYAEETRGYDLGASVAWVNPEFVVRFGSFAMPTTATGPDLAYNLNRDHGEQLEIELHPHVLRSHKPPLVVRLLGFRNVGDMGNYREALAQFQSSGSAAPDVTMTRRSRIKYGYGLNMEQALADGGNTGVFARLGWNDGAEETYGYVECDRFVSVGGQLSGAHWKRSNDVVGLALAQGDLSAAHKDYLGAGGIGSSLGDGKLNYGSERVAEAYYLYQLSKPFSLTLDYQYLNNPGYNRDRGPVSVVSMRAHYTF